MGNLLNCIAVGVRPITSLRQTALTTVQVSWSPIPELPLSGYRVYYSLTSGNGGNGTKTVAGADTSSTEITGLTNGETYIFSVEATSNFPNALPRTVEEKNITLGMILHTHNHNKNPHYSPTHAFTSYSLHRFYHSFRYQT